MSAPYRLTPRAPAAPHPTPQSASAYIQPNSKLSKPPIHNPYDKFTQPEFDAWIGGITSALRRALGEEEEPKPQTTASGTDVILSRYGWQFPAESEDEVVDDSFAEIKARRTAGKGKARDPREGPGLGKGDHAQPIEIASSDEEEEEEVEFSITMDESAEEDEEEQEEASEYSEEEEEGSWEWERGQSSSQQLRSPARKRVRAIQDEEYDEEADEDNEEYNEEFRDKYDEVNEDDEEYDEEFQDEEENEKIVQRDSISSSPIEIISDDEDDGERSVQEDEEISGDEGDPSIGSNSVDDKEIEPSRARTSSHSHLPVSYPLEGDGQAAEEGDMLDEDDEIQEIQPAEDDTSFPPQTYLSPEQPPRHVEIPDPWSGPRTYAEDFYSGGDVILPPGQKVDPSHLGPIDEDLIEQLPPQEPENMEDVDEIQPPQADTSFPQHDDEEERPIEIPDPWEGPQTYAEDFYSGGDVRALPGQPIDPSLLLGTGGLVDDIDSFLTPEILSRSQSNERNSLDDRGDEEQEDEQYIQPPSQHYDSSLRGHRLVPADAELITIDDSDEEEGPKQMEGARASPQSEIDELQYPEKDELCDSPRRHGFDVIETSSAPQEPLVQPLDFEKASQPLEDLQMPGSDITQEQDEVISNLVNWNNPPAFPTGKPASASGHLATPSPPEENGETIPLSIDEEDRRQVQAPVDVQDSEVIEPEMMEEILDDAKEMSTLEVAQAGTVSSGDAPIPMFEDAERENRESEDATVPSQDVHAEHEFEAGGTTDMTASVPVSEDVHETETSVAVDRTPGEFQPVADQSTTAIVDELMVDDDDIRSSPPSGDGNEQELQHQPCPTSPSSHVQFNLSDVSGQLPTPPSERSRHVELPQMEGDGPTCHHSSPKKHIVEMEEIPDEDDYCPQPAEPSVYMDPGVHVQKTLEYSVVEPVDDDGCTDEDADGEIDEDMEIVSTHSGDDSRVDERYDVEEAVTEGRLTEELADRAMSLGVVSVGPEDAEGSGQFLQEDEDMRQEAVVDHDKGVLEEVAAAPAEVAAIDEEGEQQEPRQYRQEDEDMKQDAVSEDVDEEITANGEGIPEEEVEVASTHEEKEHQTELTHPPAHVEPSDPQLETPIPITANADFPDPITRSQTPPPPHLSLNLGTLDTPLSPGQPIADSFAVPQSVVRPLAEGVLHASPLDATAQPIQTVDSLFTPAERSPSVEPADKPTESATLAHEDIQSKVISGDAPQQALQLEPADHVQTTPTAEQTIPTGDLSNSPTTASQPSSTFQGMLMTRKPSIPILMADPYPYSLSTPVSSMYPGHVVEVSEEEIGFDNSLTSNSTLEKEIETARLEANILDDLDNLDFQYPPESEAQTAFPNDLQTLSVVGGSDSTFTGVGSMDVFSDLLKQDTGDLAVPSVHGKEPEVGGNGNAKSAELGDIPADVVGINNVAVVSSELVKQADDRNLHQTSHEPSLGAESSQRTSKRKRDPSPSAPPDTSPARTTTSLQKGKGKKSAKSDRKSRVESELTASGSIVEDTIRVKPRPQGKLLESLQREKVSDGSPASQSSSGTSVAYRLLQPGSRASSIASSAPSEKSFSSQPSPTVNKPTLPPPAPFVPPTSLFHAHGQKRKLMAQITQQLQPRRPKPSQTPSIKHVIEQPPAPESLSPVIASPPIPPPTISPVIPTPVVSDAHTETPTQIATSSPPPSSDVAQASQPPAPTPAPIPAPIPNPPAPAIPPKAAKSPAKAAPASTPLVTRSHCRYRRISLPKEEGGPRVCFLVPGCSLNDRELMDEEEIEDHGDARNEDASRIVRDIENLNFDSDLIGVLRQLVGLDILREQEVFYLPQPGEEVVRKMPNPPRKERSSKAKAAAESPGFASSPGYSGSIRSPASVRPPVSAADSTSTSRSVLRNLLDLESERGSMVGDNNSELDPNDYDGEPRSKRARPSPPDGQEAMGPPRTQSKGKRKAKTKGGKGDDDIFQPDDSELDHSPDSKSVRKPRKSATKRGVKRTRTEVVAPEEGNERRYNKKLRLHFTAPAILPESPVKPTN